MTVDPQSIPQHVVQAGYAACYDEHGQGMNDWLERALAAALDALGCEWDDEPVNVRAEVDGCFPNVEVYPSDVLAAVLNREAGT